MSILKCPFCGNLLGTISPESRNHRLIEIYNCSKCGYTVIVTHALDPPLILFQYVPFFDFHNSQKAKQLKKFHKKTK